MAFTKKDKAFCLPEYAKTLTSKNTSVKTLFFNKMELHNIGSLRYEPKTCRRDRLGVLMIKTKCCWNGHHAHLTWHHVTFSVGLCKGSGLHLTLSFNHRTTEAENYCSIGDCYPRYAATCLAGDGLPTRCVPSRWWCTYRKFVKMLVKPTWIVILTWNFTQ